MAGLAVVGVAALTAVGWPVVAPGEGAGGIAAPHSPPLVAFGDGAAAPPPGVVQPSPTPVHRPRDANATPAPPGASQAPGDEAPTPTQVAIVPVVGFWSTETSITTAELRRALEGRSEEFARVIVSADDAETIAAALGVTPGTALDTGGPVAIRRAVSVGALGLMRLEDVSVAVRVLSLDGASLFGNGRAADLDGWPLTVIVGGEGGEGGGTTAAEWHQDETWTLVAGGDVQLDRWMAHHVTSLGKDVDWPYDGGSVRILDRECCSDLGYPVPVWKRTGGEGAVRALFGDADLAMANLEAAAVDDPAQHVLDSDFQLSLDFSGDPRLLRGLDNAGFDFVSLANNHIHNAGAEGISDTIDALDALGVDNAGAGAGPRQARQPGLLSAGDVDVAVLPCTVFGRFVGPGQPGARSCYDPSIVRQIDELSTETEVVMVFPHWGREYHAEPNDDQRRLAHSWITAGADLVLGAHSHWAGAIEDVGGSLVFYSLGNLAFDQPWSEATMQGLIVELTFHGDELVQAWLHPTLIVEEVQPNLLELDGGAARVLRRMRSASVGLLDY